MTDSGALAWRAVTFDIDGTLTTRHGWRVIAERRGKLPDYERTNRRFFALEETEDEHLRRLLELAVGMTAAELHEILELTPKIAGIDATVAALQDRGIRVGLLTHNPPYVTDWYRSRFGFEDAEGVDGPSLLEGVVGPLGAIHADKALGVTRLAERWGIPREQFVHVGDGWADGHVF